KFVSAHALTVLLFLVVFDDNILMARKMKAIRYTTVSFVCNDFLVLPNTEGCNDVYRPMH
ncbi:hypothetical protein ACJX0J_022319, partial [Zea mays]